MRKMQRGARYSEGMLEKPREAVSSWGGHVGEFVVGAMASA